jgi:hypothetical protein
MMTFRRSRHCATLLNNYCFGNRISIVIETFNKDLYFCFENILESLGEETHSGLKCNLEGNRTYKKNYLKKK